MQKHAFIKDFLVLLTEIKTAESILSIVCSNIQFRTIMFEYNS